MIAVFGCLAINVEQQSCMSSPFGSSGVRSPNRAFIFICMHMLDYARTLLWKTEDPGLCLGLTNRRTSANFCQHFLKEHACSIMRSKLWGGSHRPLYGSMCASVNDTAGGRTPCLPQAPAVENFRHYNRLTFHVTVLSQKPKKRPPLSNSSIFYFHGVLSSHCGHLQDGASPSTVLCVLLTIDIQGCSHNCLGTLAFSNDTSCLE